LFCGDFGHLLLRFVYCKAIIAPKDGRVNRISSAIL